MAYQVPPLTLLSVSPSRRDHEYLESILGRSKWRVHCVSSCPEAWTILHQATISVVITEDSFPDGHGWKDLVQEVAAMREVVPVIVTSRACGDALWMDVLAAGAFDLLPKPFEPDEARRLITLAWRYVQDVRALKAVRKSETGGRAFAAG
jgi:DNA-binding NtrC family response regulator